MSSISIGDALFTKTQQRVLGLLYGKPDQSFYTNEIVRRADMGRGTVRRELVRLVSAGLLTVSHTGNQHHYQANSDSPVYTELLNIVRKTFGVADVIRTALQPLAAKIDIAFIFGSIAKGTERSVSDVDILMVGSDVNYSDVVDLLLPVEEKLQRKINPAIYSLTSFKRKLREGNPFLQDVMRQEKIILQGKLSDLGKPG